MKKECFVILSSFLILVMAISPVVNSQKFKDENNFENNDSLLENRKKSNLLECDLGITFNKCELKPIVRKTTEYPWVTCYYRIDFNIENFGSDSFSGKVKICLITLGKYMNTTINWALNINLEPSENLSTYVKTDEIQCDPDMPNDEERYLAGKFFNLSVETLNHIDTNPKNNIDKGVAKLWFDAPDYEPTVAEVDVSSPHSYIKIPVGNNLSYYKLFYDYFDFSIFPEVLTKNRMGWVYEFSYYIHSINKILRRIICESIVFAYMVEEDLEVIIYWWEELLLWFQATMIPDAPSRDFDPLMDDFFYNVTFKVVKLVIAAQLYGELVKKQLERLNETIMNFSKWGQDKPWTKPIIISGRIKKLKKDETINITCRNFSRDCKDGDNWDKDGKINGEYKFEFLVDPDPKYGKYEPCIEWSHNCQVSIKGSKHEKILYSPKVFSQAFPNGKMKIFIPLSFSKTKSSINYLFSESFYFKFNSFETLFKQYQNTIPITTHVQEEC